MGELVVGRIESIVALFGSAESGSPAWLEGADPMFLLPLAIIVLAVSELRRCMRAGWHEPEG